MTWSLHKNYTAPELCFCKLIERGLFHFHKIGMQRHSRLLADEKRGTGILLDRGLPYIPNNHFMFSMTLNMAQCLFRKMKNKICLLVSGNRYQLYFTYKCRIAHFIISLVPKSKYLVNREGGCFSLCSALYHSDSLFMEINALLSMLLWCWVTNIKVWIVLAWWFHLQA